jgi:superfamily I DNA/RNA helicase
VITQTPELQAILCGARTNESLIIEALAGTGKTTALVEILKVMAQPSTLVLAFNKPIAEEMVRRLPQLPRGRIVHVKTLHAAGYWITKHHFPRATTVDRSVTERRIREAAGEGAPFRVLGAATKLLRICKDFQHAQELDLDEAWKLGYDFDVFGKLGSEAEVQRVLRVVRHAYRASLDVGDAIDFPDQGWLPLVLGLEPPHRYKAILLDEYQDVNPNQLAMVEKLLATGGRIIAAGDRNQAIYEWRGAATDETWDRLSGHYKAVSLPLTVTWRCDQAIVAEANQIVPTLRARPGAGAGKIEHISEQDFYTRLADEEAPADGSSIFVLSRTNAELMRVALEAWRRKVPFNITQSDDVLTPVKAVLAKLLRGREPIAAPTKGPADDEQLEQALSLFHMRRQRGEAQATNIGARVVQDAQSINRFRQQLGAWYMTEMMKASNAGSISAAERIEDQHQIILYALNYVRDPREIEGLLETIFLPDSTCWITLSSVHKAKGLEAERVYLLRETFGRHQTRRDWEGNIVKVPPKREELRIEYVGITRAKHVLTWVSLKSNE